MSDIREDFEEAAARLGYSLFFRDASSKYGEYFKNETQRAWDMWQEAHDLYTRPKTELAPPNNTAL